MIGVGQSQGRRRKLCLQLSKTLRGINNLFSMWHEHDHVCYPFFLKSVVLICVSVISVLISISVFLSFCHDISETGVCGDGALTPPAGRHPAAHTVSQFDGNVQRHRDETHRPDDMKPAPVSLLLGESNTPSTKL